MSATAAQARTTTRIYGIWLRRRGAENDPHATVEVYAETPNGWKLVITEPYDANFSHEVTALGIENSPSKDPA
jgi:hypothetical protein